MNAKNEVSINKYKKLFKPVKKRNNPEFEIQKEFFDYVETQINDDPTNPYNHIFAVPNGARCGWKTAKKLKKTGVKPGIPDCICVYKYGEVTGVTIEFKSEKGVQSKEQREWQTKFEWNGYMYYVCRSAEEAIEAMSIYSHVFY